MSNNKYSNIKTTEEMKPDILEAIPILKTIQEQMNGNKYMNDIFERAGELLENAERCKKFDIWNKDTFRVYEWAYFQIVDVIEQGGYRVEFDPPRELLRIEFPTRAAIFWNNRTYYEMFIDEIDRVTKPDYHCSSFGTFFYEPEHARESLDKIVKIKNKYMTEINEMQKECMIRRLEAEKTKLEHKIAKLKEE